MARKKKAEKEERKKDKITVGFASCDCGWQQSTKDDAAAIDAAVSHSLRHMNATVFHHYGNIREVVFSRRTA